MFSRSDVAGLYVLPKKAITNAALGRLQAFRMYGGIGMSASSLHRESTDSLIISKHVHYGILQLL